MLLTSHFPQRRSRVGGFTLVELLTVIAIIGVLVAILIPTIGKARDSARSGVCASNLRQIAAASLLYASEHRGRLVPLKDGATNETWRVKLEPYLAGRRAKENPLICPADSVTEYPDSSSTGEWPFSYGFNSASQFANGGPLLEYSAGSVSQMMSAIKNPSGLIMVTDIGRSLSGGGGSPESWTEDKRAAPGNTSSSLGYARFPWNGNFNLEWSVWGRHGGGRKANAAFYDGSVRVVDLIADLKNHPNGDPLCLFDNH